MIVRTIAASVPRMMTVSKVGMRRYRRRSARSAFLVTTMRQIREELSQHMIMALARVSVADTYIPTAMYRVWCRG